MTVAGSDLVGGRYRVEKLLGEGGMGRVWLAKDVVLNRDVAVKEIVLAGDLKDEERSSLQRRTLREARAAARLTHPNVAQVYDVFEVEGQPWIVMEYVPSRSLQEVGDAEGPLKPRRVAQIGLEVLAALQVAHRAGVLHRDVKPSNVLLTDSGRVVLTDFGIATIEGDGNNTSSNLMVGSPQFMAPERALRGESLPASDLWSLGATLYAAVEGRTPYQRPSAVGTLMALAAEEPEPPHRSGALRPVLDGLLRKQPDERIDAEETRRRLTKVVGRKRPIPQQRRAKPPVPEAAVAAPADTAVSEPGAPPRPGAGGSRRRKIVLAVAAFLAVAGSVVLIALQGHRPSASSSQVPGAKPSAGASPTSSAGGSASSSPLTSTNPGTGTGTSASPSTSPSDAGSDGQGSRPALPSGWTDYHDKTGFSVYVPKGWTKSQDGSIVYFRSSGRVLGIDQTTHPIMNPVADWQEKADYRVSHGDFPGYRKIHIQSVDYFKKAADWEFTFDGSSARQHVNNRGLVVNDHQAYGMYWQTPDSQWKDANPDLQLIFNSFRPKS